MLNSQCGKSNELDSLRKIIAKLRAPDGCPWDKEQTHKSIRRNFLEEAYETCEAIDLDDAALLKEELGDVLTQVMFHAQIEEEAGRFTLDDVAAATCEKLIFRHPHIFGTARADDAAAVMDAWEELKREEKAHKTVSDSMHAVAKSLPATWRAEKIQAKAQKVGFDFPTIDEALDKLLEEFHELSRAIKNGQGQAEELGDLLFSAVNISRLLQIDPEDALHESASKFTKRFEQMEQMAIADGQALDGLSLGEMEAFYQRAKEEL